MKITGNTILITGGATGIGLALAEVFLREGNQVIICGRTEKKLQEAKSKLPLLLIRVCDVSKDSESWLSHRLRLFLSIVRQKQVYIHSLNL